jgi:hypothetical protein
MKEMINNSSQREWLPWPQMPYKGFSFYGPNDVPLFAGRDRQIVEFANMVARPEARFVLLYGATGCGKSSFLRAGLIPYLEGRLRGFEFRKQNETQSNKALFIRSTDAPLQKLAEEVFRLASEKFAFQSPDGLECVDLSEALHGTTLMDDFCSLVISQPRALVGSLRLIAAALPVTLVLVIDQGEEVLSLGGGLELERQQSKYFEFLARFGESDFPLKLIIALRNEFYGDFQAAINEHSPDPTPLFYYRLKNLGAEQLVTAIKRPTQSTAFDNYGPPTYGFEFADGLPELIVEDLINTAKAGGLVGGELPVLQVVCETLYQKTKSRQKPWLITVDDYKQLGGIETQLNDYVDRLLIAFCDEIKVPTKQRAISIIRWKDALMALARLQPNNTVTTDRKTIDDIDIPSGLAPADFAEFVKYLANDERGVLREEKIRRLGSQIEISCFSLRHDAVGLVLVRWKDAREATQGSYQGFASIFDLFGSLYVGIGLVFFGMAFVPTFKDFVVNVFPEIQLFLNPFDGQMSSPKASTKTFLVIFGLGSIIAGLAFPFLFQARGRGLPREFVGFRFQLLSVVDPLFRIVAGKRRLNREGIKALEQNPIFRLYILTFPGAERLFNRARQRIAR